MLVTKDDHVIVKFASNTLSPPLSREQLGASRFELLLLLRHECVLLMLQLL